MEAIVVAVVGVVGAAVGATLSTWLGAREAVRQELRDLRLKTYPAVWESTSVVSRWPRTDANLGHLSAFHKDLRTWYYSSGGLYLSENARARYGDMQKLLEACVNGKDVSGNIDDSVYKDVMDTTSAFRTALTEDLESRQQRSLVHVIKLALQHRKQASRARQRQDRAPKVTTHRHTIRLTDQSTPT